MEPYHQPAADSGCIESDPKVYDRSNQVENLVNLRSISNFCNVGMLRLPFTFHRLSKS